RVTTPRSTVRVDPSATAELRRGPARNSSGTAFSRGRAVPSAMGRAATITGRSGSRPGGGAPSGGGGGVSSADGPGGGGAIARDGDSGPTSSAGASGAGPGE